VNTLLADPPVLANPEQPPATEAPGAPPPGEAPEASETSTASQPTCANCGAAMTPGQDWCLQCGAGAPGSLDGGGPSWRSAAVILTATAVLVLGAAAAAFAALDKESTPAHRTIVAVASTPSTATPTPTTPVTPTPTTPGAVTPTPKASETPAVTPLPSTGSATPPKIPLTAPTPKSSPTTTTPAKTNESSGTSAPSEGGGESGSGSGSGTTTGSQPVAITLDPDAASTYNPYGYPESEFGDPSLAIDGDTSTAWTAQVNPAVAPKMAEGLVIDLKSARRLSAIGLVTATPGMSVQVYGANGSAPPTSITDPAWTQLSAYLIAKKHNGRIKLQNSTKAFRFVALWISKAPAASVGTAQAPGHVAVNELELFPVK
jgi:hypothetical protein